MITHRRRLAGALLVPLLFLTMAACTDSDDGADSPAGEEKAEGPNTAEFSFRALDVGGPNTRAALEAGDIDIALLFSSDGAIAANGWVALEDDQGLQQAENFVPAIRTEATSDDIAAVLDAVSEGLTDDVIRAAVARVSIDGDNPEDVAADVVEELAVSSDLTAEGELKVGSANFAESTLVSQIYGQALEAAGVSISYTPEIGARDVYFPALESGEIDLIPEFTGSLALFLDDTAEPGADPEAAREVAADLAEARDVTLLGIAPAQSANTFVVTAETAETYDLAKMSDLVTVEDPLVLGGPPECPQRDFCILGLKEVYRLKFAS